MYVIKIKEETINNWNCHYYWKEETTSNWNCYYYWIVYTCGRKQQNHLQHRKSKNYTYNERSYIWWRTYCAHSIYKNLHLYNMTRIICNKSIIYRQHCHNICTIHSCLLTTLYSFYKTLTRITDHAATSHTAVQTETCVTVHSELFTTWYFSSIDQCTICMGQQCNI